ncbi:MAG TPA: SIMPL domain-containing protein [Pyrinomonadaceae bacterium]|nr:SIMPL domain-containing protein [Pyrinomonadaceae bacterium]
MNRQVLSIFSAVALVLALSGATLAKEITVRGRLQKTVEAGGWVIATGSQKYLILNAQRFKNEKWFKESTEVEAVGETKDVMTIYMEGTPFEVRTLRPLEQGGSEVIAGATDSRLLSRVVVSGDSIVQAQPDTAILTIAVVTQAKRAIDAQQENASRSDAVVRALKAAAGTGAEIKTSGYSLQPQRVYRENQPPTITGYEARNSVIVVLSDLTKVGPVIDAAAQAGANDLSGISFTLRKDRPARDQALTEATREAMSKAQVIAQALGGRVVRVVEVQEEGTARPMPIYSADYGREVKLASVQTPIEVGTLDITSRVQLIAEVEAVR